MTLIERPQGTYSVGCNGCVYENKDTCPYDEGDKRCVDEGDKIWIQQTTSTSTQ